MISKKIGGLSGSIICAALIFMTAAAVRTTFAQCEKVTDAQIVADIYGKIKNDKGLASQMTHINVVSVYAAVRFQGWANNKGDYDQIVGFASNHGCVKLVNVNNFMEEPPPNESPLRLGAGCARGTKACGDICIPEGDACNISGFVGMQTEILRLERENLLGWLERPFACKSPL
jgi:hypothetical protein